MSQPRARSPAAVMALARVWNYYLDTSDEFPEDVAFLNELDQITLEDINEEHPNENRWLYPYDRG